MLAFFALAALPARANVVVTFTQGTGDIDASVSGSLDVSQFHFVVSGVFASETEMQPSASYFAIDFLGEPGSFYSIPNEAVPAFGSSNAVTKGTWISGQFSFATNGSHPDQIILPDGYVSGSALTAEGTFAGTLAQYGFPSSDVVVPLPGNQTLTYAFVAPASTPEPSTLALAGLALLAAAYGVRAGKSRSR